MTFIPLHQQKQLLYKHSKQHCHIPPPHIIPQCMESSFDSLDFDIKANIAGSMNSSRPESQHFASSLTMSVFPASPQLRLVAPPRPGKRARSTSAEPQTQNLTFAPITRLESLDYDIESIKRAGITALEFEGQPRSGLMAMTFYDKNAPPHLQRNWRFTMGTRVSCQTFRGFGKLPNELQIQVWEHSLAEMSNFAARVEDLGLYGCIQIRRPYDMAYNISSYVEGERFSLFHIPSIRADIYMANKAKLLFSHLFRLMKVSYLARKWPLAIGKRDERC